MIKYHSINGKITSVKKAALKVSDLSILRGFGVFDYFLVERGIPLFLDDYTSRFENSVGLMGMDLLFPRTILKDKIRELIAANKISEGAVRLVQTGGYSEDSFTPAEPNLLILQHQRPTYPSIMFEKGLKLILHQYQRELPEAKTTNYIRGIRMIPELKRQNAFDLLFHDGEHVSEATRSNFFIVTKEEEIWTADTGILKGITRNNLLKIGTKDFAVKAQAVSLKDVREAKEAFLTSTTKGAIAVVQIGDWQIGDGKPGEITQKLATLLKYYYKAYLNNSVKV